jgi:hypothetical protein
MMMTAKAVPASNGALIYPTGKSMRISAKLKSSPLVKNILIFRNGKSVYILPIPSHKRGASRSSRTLVRDAVDAAMSHDE